MTTERDRPLPVCGCLTRIGWLPSLTPRFTAQEEGDELFPEFGFFPDLEALRFWSHPRNSTNMERQQGVLWKRRDIFTNRWRPRWFVLQPSQGILTYYLLSESVPDTVANPVLHRIAMPLTEPLGLRNRTTSFDSNVSSSTLDYDVVPRGTIYLLGCTVEANESLTSPEENLYAFTIRPADQESRIHLAARTASAREAWVRKIAQVCAPPFETQALEEAVPEEPSPSNGSTVPPSTPPREDTPVLSEPPMVWKSLASASDLYQGLDDSLAERIKQTLKTGLETADEEPNSVDWKVLFKRNDGSAAWQRKGGSHAMIRSSAVLNHPVKQVFSLLIDSPRRSQYESNVRASERVKILNPHTFIDYYSYSAIWPASPREFAVITHWQVVGKGEDKAVVTCSFSSPEADQARPREPGHTRGALFVNLSLLRPVDAHQCHYTRLLSFDIGGSSSHFSNVIISQHAGFPSIVNEYLLTTEPLPEQRAQGPLTDEVLMKDFVSRLGETQRKNPQLANGSPDRDSVVVSPPRDTKLDAPRAPTVEQQATLLFAPLIAYRVLAFISLPLAAILFVIVAFMAVRQVVLLHLGDLVPDREEQGLVGPVTCRFKVDLKGVLRFIANKKEEREELKTGSADVSVLHIVACAVAKALKREEMLNVRRVRIPWLCIDVVAKCRGEHVSVSISQDASKPLTVQSVDESNVQAVADEMERLVVDDGRKDAIGRCLVLATPNYDRVDMETDAIPHHEGVKVVAVIGGVRLERNNTVRHSGFGSSNNPRPVLALSLSIANSRESDFIACRRFAEEVQKLLQFPEMCDN